MNLYEFLNGGSFRFLRAWSWKIYNEGMPWRIFAKAACPMVVCLLVIEVVQMNFSGLGSRKLCQFPLLVFLTSKALLQSWVKSFLRFFVWVSRRLKIVWHSAVCCQPCLKWAKMVIFWNFLFRTWIFKILFTQILSEKGFLSGSHVVWKSRVFCQFVVALV